MANRQAGQARGGGGDKKIQIEQAATTATIKIEDKTFPAPWSSWACSLPSGRQSVAGAGGVQLSRNSVLFYSAAALSSRLECHNWSWKNEGGANWPARRREQKIRERFGCKTGLRVGTLAPTPSWSKIWALNEARQLRCEPRAFSPSDWRREWKHILHVYLGARPSGSL